jgi:hypothetical protein
MNDHCLVRGIKAWSVGAKFPIQVDLKFSIIFIVGNEGMGFPW